VGVSDAGETGYDPVTGCRLETNQTDICEKEFGSKVGPNSCFRVKCLPNYQVSPVNCTDWLEDTCVPSNKCYTSKCEEDGNGGYHCVETAKPHDADTPCKKMKCSPLIGWVNDENQERNKSTCRKFLKPYYPNEEDLKCKNFYCNNSKTEGEPCYFEDRPDCNAKCTDSKESQCEGEARLEVTLNSCFTKHCGVREKNKTSESFSSESSSSDSSEMDYELFCNSTNAVDCMSEAVQAQLSVLNEENKYTACYNVVCKDGECLFEVLDPEREIPESNKCQRAVCKKVGDYYSWSLEDTEEAAHCGERTTECAEYSCDGKLGCVPNDICTKETPCGEYVCVNNSKCIYNSTLEETECMIQMCIYDRETQAEIGRKWTEKDDLDAVCHNSAKCIISKCNSSTGLCYFEKSKQPEDDPCRDFTCDNETGWSAKPHCYDGLFCTKDACIVDSGMVFCSYEPRSCTEELDITDRCYYGECVEDEANYSCKVGVVPGAVIDICGKCVLESDFGSGSEVDVECVDTPAPNRTKEGLAAASIGLIVLGAILIGAAVATSGVITTKTLIERARAANNQSAHSNPLFEGNNAEMTNPTYGDADAEE